MRIVLDRYQLNDPTTDVADAVLTRLGWGAYPTVGAVIVARRPGNRIGWLCCTVGLLLGPAFFAQDYAWYAAAATGETPPSMMRRHLFDAYQAVAQTPGREREAVGRIRAQFDVQQQRGLPEEPSLARLGRSLRVLEICANKDRERCRRRGRPRFWLDRFEWLRPLSFENIRSVGFSDRPVQFLVFRRRQDE
jgi:hypothetical protein